MDHEDQKWYLVRRQGKTNKWHPATDNALGEDKYGEVTPDSKGSDTFSMKYDTMKWDKIMFAYGDFT